ncbi:MAG: hypothetical protein K5798_02835 [Nitrosopumilus sp.]|uniref:hypothetical protein n=1 Tax=Nitrosopumilus sp. TaxID=2024843 RepID=UPI00242DA60F|nr:hypothetical protein [Nitrosopumilus sp.]MCV0366186.1 hypothetical protein [Nitrosopumilus sp.]
MKTKLLIVIAVFLVMVPWVRGLEFGMNDQVMADGITMSSIIVMTLAIVFSLVSWILFSWASKNIPLIGIPLSIITGASLLIPFGQVLGPMAGIIVGVVAGFAAFMLQKKITHPAQNTSMIIAAVTIAATYLVLTLMILAIQTPSHVWNTGDGIGAWTGTAQGMEEKGFDNIFNNHIGFSYFLALIPSLIITGLIIQDKTKSKSLIITGSIFMVSALLYVFVMSASGQCYLSLTFCTNFYESNYWF